MLAMLDGARLSKALTLVLMVVLVATVSTIATPASLATEEVGNCGTDCVYCGGGSGA